VLGPGELRAGGFERGGNTKTHGIVRGEFIVHDGLPANLRHGIFAEPRTYRVSRIHDVAILPDSAVCPPGFALAEWWDRSSAEFREHLPRYYATFRADDSVMRWARYRGWRLQEETPDGNRVRFRLRFDVADEARQFALSFGPEIEVLEPAELREAVLSAAREILLRSV